METRLSLAPGQNGTRKLLARYGERLVRVRYRYDAERQVRHKTVELIVETAPWNPRRRNVWREPHDMVAVRIGYAESDLRQCIKAAGAIWRPRQPSSAFWSGWRRMSTRAFSASCASGPRHRGR